MKFLKKNRIVFVVLVALLFNNATGQESKPKLLVNLVYHLKDNTFPYVTVFTKSKIGKKFIAVPGISVNVYLGEENEGNLMGTVQTDRFGRGNVAFPVKLLSAWDTASTFKLVAVSVADKAFASAGTEITTTKSKITIDTSWADGARSIAVTVTTKKGNEWLPAKDVETKIIIQRSVGNLSVGDKETYTTDSSGKVSAEFTNKTIPGDADGNIVIIAKTEENELFGSISMERKVKWGAAFMPPDNFNKRTLFATRGKAPLWLLFLAGSIFVSVWCVIIYLVFQIKKMRKTGNDNLLIA
ncbi:MAG: hypothetical protein V4539_12005 [Bacteroidota bacterium]